MKLFRRAKNGVVSGDAIPMFHDGVYHVFFLTSPEHTVNYPERIRTTWYHMISKDLVNWEELEPALVPGVGATIDKDGCWTGSAIYGEEKYHIFYTAADLDSEFPQKIGHAVSEDGIHFTKDGDQPCIVPITEYYENIDWRDPYVFYNQDEACYWILIAARKNTGPDTRRACVALFKSQDLIHWEHYGPIYEPGYTNVTECPEMFKMGNFWYLTHSRFSEFAQTVYRYSKSPYGPWRTPRFDGIGGRRCYAAKSMANDQGRRFYFAWIHERATPDDRNHWCWGGDFCIPHEIVQREDGELEFKLPYEIESTFDRQLEWRFTGRQGDIECLDQKVELNAVGTMAYGFFDVIEDQFLMHCSMTPDNCRGSVNVLLKADDDLAVCYILSLDWGAQRAYLTKYPVPMDPYWADASVAVKDFSVMEPDGPRVCEKAYPFCDGDRIDLKIVIDHEIMEIFIGEKTAFSFRCYRPVDHQIGLMVLDGNAVFDQIEFVM